MIYRLSFAISSSFDRKSRAVTALVRKKTDRDKETNRIQYGFGEVLRKHREKQGISQVDLALEADYHWTYISQTERVKRQPGPGAVFILCKHLGLNPSSVIKEVEKRLKWRK